MGVLYQSSAKVGELKPTDMAKFNSQSATRKAEITADLDRLHKDLRHKADQFPFYPVVSLQLNYYI
jgi:hypothetical protein